MRVCLVYVWATHCPMFEDNVKTLKRSYFNIFFILVPFNINHLLAGYSSWTRKYTNPVRPPQLVNNKATNNGSSCSVLFLCMTGLFPGCKESLKQDTKSGALAFF